MKNVLVTGGCGFIGSNFVKYLISLKCYFPIILDKLTYAGSKENINQINEESFELVEGDICDEQLLLNLFKKYKFDGVFHFAAESHVDRSIDGPKEFIDTNIIGTFNLLQASRANISKNKNNFKFIHISTDEVYGDILKNRSNEKFPYNPSSPYAASKAASDHLVSSYVRTYKIPAIVTNCSNNYGPKQHPEKLIPKLIYNILNNKPLPIYGKGTNSREWIYVKDHCEALIKVFLKGKIGEFYNIGSNKNLNNLQVCSQLLAISKKLVKVGKNVKINFVKDRPGHDIRYALNSNKIIKKLGWKPKVNFQEGIKLTFEWYNKNKSYYKNLSRRDIVKRLGR